MICAIALLSVLRARNCARQVKVVLEEVLITICQNFGRKFELCETVSVTESALSYKEMSLTFQFLVPSELRNHEI